MYRVVSRSERCIALCGSFGELIQQDRLRYKLRNNDVLAGGQVYLSRRNRDRASGKASLDGSIPPATEPMPYLIDVQRQRQRMASAAHPRQRRLAGGRRPLTKMS